MQKVCVLGLGYVGLTLAVVLAERGFQVVGVEVSQPLAEAINQGDPHFHEDGLKGTLNRTLGLTLKVTTQVPQEPQDAYIIAVGTPITKDGRNPILDYLVRATQSILPHLRDETLVVVRSTVPVGCTRGVVLPLLQSTGRRVSVAYCPERTAEGVALRELRELPQVIGGLDEESVRKAQELFRKITPIIMQVSSLEAAEAIKLFNNAYRDLTFAFANQMAIAWGELGLDPVELTQAANFGYPRSHIPVPGFVGGTCLDKDPFLLLHSVRDGSSIPTLVRLSREINSSLPLYIKEKLEAKLKEAGKSLHGAKVLISGLAFKGNPETDDLRASPALDFLELLRPYTNEVRGHDFVVSREAISAAGMEPCDLEQGFRGADAAVIMNNHRLYQRLEISHYLSLMDRPAVFIDGWHIFEPLVVKSVEGIHYGGIGIG